MATRPRTWVADRVTAALAKRGRALTRARFHEDHDLDLRALLAAPVERAKGRFVVLQIGANDGVVNDPIHDAVVGRSWDLYAVEPVPATFAKLERTYAGNPRVRCIPAAVGDTDGERTIYALRQDDGVGGLPYDQFASFSRATVEQHWHSIPNVKAHVQEVTVPVLTLTSLVERYDVPEIDLLQIDVEGYDYEVVRMAFAAGIVPTVLAFEWVNLGQDDMWRCRGDLVARGYRWLINKGDVIAYRGDIAAPTIGS